MHDNSPYNSVQISNKSILQATGTLRASKADLDMKVLNVQQVRKITSRMNKIGKKSI
jgi:hypothetical protein